MKNKISIAAVIPAHNEEYSIEKIIESLCLQTHPVDKIVVINDGSTDSTQEILDRLKLKIPILISIKNETPAFRSGAINAGFSLVKNTDFILVVDADSIVDSHIVEEGAKTLIINPTCGGVCSTAGVLNQPIKNLTHLFLQTNQRLEYGGFNAERIATWKNVMILHGLCTMFRTSAVINVGGYTSGHLLEDYDLTLKLKKSGWNTYYNPKMKAFTKTPDTFKKFIKQRIRWYRGGVDILIDHGINKFTYLDFIQHAMFISLLTALVYVVISKILIYGLSIPTPMMSPIPILLVAIGYIFNMYRVKFIENFTIKDVIIKAMIIPELIMAMLQSIILLYAYTLVISRKSKMW